MGSINNPNYTNYYSNRQRQLYKIRRIFGKISYYGNFSIKTDDLIVQHDYIVFNLLCKVTILFSQKSKLNFLIFTIFKKFKVILR